MKIMTALKYLRFLLKTKGFRYTYNFLHYNIFWGLRTPFLIKLIQSLESYPSYIEVEVTTRCNLKCIICERTYWDEPNRDMSFEEFKYIIDQFPRLKWIGLTGIGESFINKDFLKMLEYVKSKDILIELYDTFYFIDKKTSEELVRLKVDKVFASIDAATKQTYEKIRVGSDFEKIIANVKELFRQKKEKETFFPKISFHYIVNKLNLSEIPQYIDLVNNITEGSQTSIQFTRMLHEYKQTKDLFTEVPKEIIDAANEKSKKFNIPVQWNANIPACKPPINKCIEWIMPFIFVTGDVIPCCAGNEAGNRSFQKETSLGNIFNQDFKKIWHEEKYKRLRKMIKRGEVPLACKNCCLYAT